jgi:choline kinase
MRAIILAAGRGSRMGDLTEERPKCLLEFAGKTLLYWQKKALTEAGVTEIGIVTGYRRELVAQADLVEFHNAEWTQTNMVSSLACADAWLQSEPCIVSYADLYFEAAGLRQLADSVVSLTITYDRNWLALWQKRFENPLEDAETFRLNADGTLKEIGARPQTVEEVEGQYMGLLRIAPDAWEEIQRIRQALPDMERAKLDVTSLLQKVIEGGRVPINTVPYEGKWAEYDSPDDLDVSGS